MADQGIRATLVTIRVTELEHMEVKRLVYLRKSTLAKLFRAWVAGELARFDRDLPQRLHGARGAAAARAKVVPLRPVRKSGSR
jgi:hypothetical protein